MNIHIVDHTHWDREWHKTYQEFRVKLITFMDNLIEVLDNNEDYESFLLDGQTSLLEDYLEVKPENKNKIKKLIENEKLLVGPWYVQPDTFIPSGESLVRNLLISNNIGHEYGNIMKIGYLPDSFGLSSQVPQILKGFDIDSAIFYRGSSRDDINNLDFIWSSPDGSEVFTSVLTMGYGNGMYLSGDLENDLKEIDRNIENLSDYSIDENLLLLSGADQDNINRDMPEIINNLNNYYNENNIDIDVKFSSLRQYIDTIKDIDRNKLEEFTGEFRKAEFGRVHASIEGTRVDIKKDNTELQDIYTHELEPINVISYLLGSDYKNSIINKGWKYIIENHAHDSICSVCTDEIHDEIKMRFEWANQISNTIIDEKMAYIFKNIKKKKDMKPIITINSLPHYRNEIVTAVIYSKSEEFIILDENNNEIYYEIIQKNKVNLAERSADVFQKSEDDYYYKCKIIFKQEIEGFGYNTFYIKKGLPKKINNKNLISEKILENKYLKAKVEVNGSITLEDKINSNTFKNLNIFEESGNAGDEYDYSPPQNDVIITTKDSKPNIKIIENNKLKGTILIEYNLRCPQETNKNKRSDNYRKINIKSYVTLKKDSKKLDIKTKIDNKIKNHRIRAIFDSNLKAKEHFADSKFGAIVRKNEFDETETWREKEWHEKYYPIFPLQKFVTIERNEKGIAVLNKDIPQYEIINENNIKIALTLVSGVSHMGKRDLINRPGRRSGIHIETPDAQMLGENISEYSIYPYNNDYMKSGVPQMAINNSIPIKALTKEDTIKYFSTIGNDTESIKKFDSKLKLLNIKKGIINTSTIKKSEKEDSIVWRLYNPTHKEQNNIILEFNNEFFSNIDVIDLKEDIIDDERIEIKDNNIYISSLSKNEVLTLKLSFID